ncbi:hypothetical protein JCM9279_006233 [Rhodotorula babjevae]
MDSTAPATQPCHLDRLPNELINEILQHTVAADDPPQRRRKLLRLGRCSKRIARLAQRLLWRHVSLSGVRLPSLRRNQDPLHRVVVAFADLEWTAGTVKTLEIEHYTGGEPLHLNLFAMALPGVESLKLGNVGKFDLTHTAFFHELRTLSLDKVVPFLSPRQAPIVFTKLVSLDVRGLDLSVDPTAAATFSRTTFPALRHLSLRGFPRNAGAVGVFPPLSSDFIGQLDDLQLDLYDQRNLDARHFPTTTPYSHDRPIIFHCPSLFALKRPFTRSILPVQYLIVDDPDWIHTLKTKFARIHLLPALRLILVPDFPCFDSPSHFARRVARRASRLAQHGIVLRTFDFDESLSQVVQREFVGYLRERAAAAAAAAAT